MAIQPIAYVSGRVHSQMTKDERKENVRRQQ